MTILERCAGILLITNDAESPVEQKTRTRKPVRQEHLHPYAATLQQDSTAAIRKALALVHSVLQIDLWPRPPRLPGHKGFEAGIPLHLPRGKRHHAPLQALKRLSAPGERAHGILKRLLLPARSSVTLVMPQVRFQSPVDGVRWDQPHVLNIFVSDLDGGADRWPIFDGGLMTVDAELLFEQIAGDIGGEGVVVGPFDVLNRMQRWIQDNATP